MTDLPTILPAFSTSPYTHLVPSLDRHGITTADLLSLDALEIAKRASLPILDLRRLAQNVASAIQDDLDIAEKLHNTNDAPFSSSKHASRKCKQSVIDVLERWETISILDARLDCAIGGGIPAGYVTEITGERSVKSIRCSIHRKGLTEDSAAGKTQFLLTLLLSVQLPAPSGLSRSSIYISTEAPLSTTRLAQILESHPRLSELAVSDKPSLSRVLAIPVQDLESQDHILAFQLPNAIRRYNVGLVVLDSVAANYRAEHGSAVAKDLASRAAQLAKLGKHLRDIAKEENIAIVVANQVSDRFEELSATVRFDHSRCSSPILSSSPAPPSTQGIPPSSTGHTESTIRESILTLDFQQRFFTGWGDQMHGMPSEGMKTPALGLSWTNQIACRIALKMDTWRAEAIGENGNISGYQGGNIWKNRKKKRFLRLVFAPWTIPTADPIEYEIRPSGIAACNADEAQT
jgi:DNA repair protein RAD57